jgi:hypothetical protein
MVSTSTSWLILEELGLFDPNNGPQKKIYQGAVTKILRAREEQDRIDKEIDDQAFEDAHDGYGSGP